MLDPGRVLPLSEYDTSLVGAPPVDLLLHYPRPLDAERLRAALGPVLEAFNVFASRLASPREGEFTLVHDPAGAVFAVRPRLDWSGGDLSIDLLNQCVDRVRTMPGEPLTKLTLTPTAAGTLLGLSVSHTVADASSMQELFRAWSQVVLGRGRPAPPARRRYRPDPGDTAPPTPSELGTDRPMSPAILTRLEGVFSTSYSLSLHLETAHVRELQRAASADGQRASVNEAVTAYIMRRFAKQMVPLGSCVRVHIPIDLRSLHPEVEVGFIGNAFIVVSERFEDAEVAELPYPALAARLRACLARGLDRASLLERIRMGPHGLEYRQLEWSDGQLLDVQSDIVSSNLMRMRVAAADLGSGLPVAGLVPLPAPAGFVILPSFRGADGLDVQLYAKHPLAPGDAR